MYVQSRLSTPSNRSNPFNRQNYNNFQPRFNSQPNFRSQEIHNFTNYNDGNDFANEQFNQYDHYQYDYSQSEEDNQLLEYPNHPQNFDNYYDETNHENDTQINSITNEQNFQSTSQPND